jgi:hypothetical protein
MTNTDDLVRALLYAQAGQTSALERMIDLAAREVSLRTRQRTRIASLEEVEFKAYSQWGEDGIIDWLIETIEIGAERFIEFGVENYRESNTRFLLKRRNWKGLVIDRSEEDIRVIKADEISWRHDLTAVSHFITRENINALFTRAGFVGPIGLLSIDIDGMDYWVWEKIDAVRPDIVVCEYNAAFGDIHPVTVPYDPDFQRMRAHYSGWYFGASIGALCHLAARKGYALVGTNSAGSNAFFVLEHHYETLAARIGDKRPRAPRFKISRDASGQLDHKSIIELTEPLASMPLERVDTREVLAFGDLEPIFSAEWIRQVRAETPPAMPGD